MTSTVGVGERQAFKLWALLDDIDTLDDACRADDAAFREQVRAIQRRRFEIMSGEQWDNLATRTPAPSLGEDVVELLSSFESAIRVGEGFSGGRGKELSAIRVSELRDKLLAALSSMRPVQEEGVGEDGPWLCFHCGDVFTDRSKARLHFGRDEGSTPACIIKGADGGLLRALRDAEEQADNAIQAVQDECTDAAKAYHRQRCHHNQALIAAEEAGYERGLADGRADATRTPAPSLGEDVVERVAMAVSGPLANMNGGCFKPDNGRSQRGECADRDCYCARVTRHVARAALSAMRPVQEEGVGEAQERACELALAGRTPEQFAGHDGPTIHAFAEVLEVLRLLLTRVRLDIRCGTLPPEWGGEIVERARNIVEGGK